MGPIMAGAQQQEHTNTMYDQRLEEIITPNDGKPATRIARFLKPIAKNTNTVEEIPQTPFIHEVFSHKNLKKWPFRVHFTGWKKPQKDWDKWYQRLVENHGTEWLKAGIIDGVHSSVHEVPCNKEIVLGVCEFWCSKTNTFMFPWGEATITLEDVMVLGGFPVLGSSLDKEVEGDLVEIVDGLERARWEIHRDKEEATHTAWIQHFREEVEEGEIGTQEGELEHAAFLALWLSRFVFPDLNESVIRTFVFPIAAHLSKGTPISLAPLVLANIYLDLTLLAGKAIDPCVQSKKVYVSSLMKIVQLWVFERFPVFAEGLAKPLSNGFPRVARWENVRVKIDLPYVRSKIKVGEGFLWRPYAHGVKNWELLPFYEEKERVLDDSMDLPCSDLPSFGWFCFPLVLDAVAGKVKYQPHRVAMQLGYDQDLPGECSDCKSSYDQVGFVVPSRSFQPGLSRRYYDWWKDSMLCHEKRVRDSLGLKGSEDCGERLVSEQDGEGNGLEQKGNDCSNFPCVMQTPPVVDGPVILDVQPTTENELSTKPLSDPSIEEKLEEGEMVEETGISETVALASPDLSNSNSGGSHASVSPHSLSLLKQPTSKDDGDHEDVSNALDHIPLALRICSQKAKESDRGNRTTELQTPVAPLSLSQVSYPGFQASDNLNNNSVPKKCVNADVDELDHVPLAMRLQAISRNQGTPIPSESFASSGHVVASQRLKPSTQIQELACPTSDDGSQITMKRCSTTKTMDEDKDSRDNAGSVLKARRKEDLATRLAKLEKRITAMERVKKDSKLPAAC